MANTTHAGRVIVGYGTHDKEESLDGTRRKCPMGIRQADYGDMATLAALIRESNKDVAALFGLNAENCPKHPSFCTEQWVKADFQRGEIYFLLEKDSESIGCVAYESTSPGLAYLNRLSVLPAYRRQGFGARLFEYVVQYARVASVKTISIGVIGEHFHLQRWYQKLGFKDGEVKRFPHLPFSVIYMAFEIAETGALGS